MKEGNGVATRPAAALGPRRFRLTLPRTVLVALVCFVLAAFAVVAPIQHLAHQSPAGSDGGLWFWGLLPFGVVGFVVAWRRPANRLGWIFVGVVVALALSAVGGTYAVADYRVRHGTLPLGWVAMLAQPAWAPMIVLAGLAVLLFPDGTPASPPLRRALWLYLVPALLWMVSAYVLTAGAIIGHDMRVDAGGNPLVLAGPTTPGWWNVLQGVVFISIALAFVLSLAGQVASYRRSSGERRQQLKWLLGGLVACLAGSVTAIGLGHAAGFWGVAGHVALLAALVAVPVSMGVAILKYRLYDIDRIISRTLAYAIVTGLLIGIYAGLVLLATGVFRLHTPVAVAAATLAGAALFNPLRRRVQRRVDRWFNRTRYDADQTIAVFAGRLKDTVDLDSVRDDLATVVNQALEPAHVSVWISQQD